MICVTLGFEDEPAENQEIWTLVTTLLTLTLSSLLIVVLHVIIANIHIRRLRLSMIV